MFPFSENYVPLEVTNKLTLTSQQQGKVYLHCAKRTWSVKTTKAYVHLKAVTPTTWCFWKIVLKSISYWFRYKAIETFQKGNRSRRRFPPVWPLSVAL